MKATKQATPGTSGRSAAARGKFWKVCMVLLLLVTAVFCGFAPQAWALTPNAEGVYELRTPQEIAAAVGEYVFVKLKDPKAGMDSVKGTMTAYDEDGIVVEYMAKAVKKKITIDPENIALIRLSVKI